jgi:hypothetical protein
MFGKKNFTNTQIKGRLTNPEDDILINADNNNLTLYSKYKKGDGNLGNKTTVKFRDELSDIKLYQSTSGLLDYNGNLLSTENKHLEDGLVLWYDKLIDADSGLITDKSGNDINGTLTSITNRDDGLLYFDGSDDYISSNINPIKEEGSHLTISLWIKPKYTKQYMYLINQASSLYKSYYLYIVRANNNKIVFKISSGTYTYSISTSDKIIFNKWTHILCTYDNTIMKIYINGKLSNFSYSSMIINTSSNNFIIGTDTTNVYPYNGYMKDIRIYNRAINTNEITELYNIGLVSIKDDTGDITLPDPVIYLKMQDGLDNTVYNYGTDKTNVYGTIYNYNSNWSFLGKRYCVGFDGTNDYIDISSSSTLTGQLTISLWFYYLEGGDLMIIIYVFIQEMAPHRTGGILI